MTTGLTAGFLAAFAHTVMPALATTDDSAFVGTFQILDKAVYNPWFMVPFTLVPVLVAASPAAGPRRRPAHGSPARGGRPRARRRHRADHRCGATCR